MINKNKSTYSKILKVNNKVNKAFKVFQKAQKKLETAQEKLQKVINESHEKIEAIQHSLKAEKQHKDLAEQAYEENERLKQKLNEFTSRGE